MSLNDVSATVENLAVAVNQKLADLTRLQHEYLAKINLLNRYISQFQPDDNEQAEQAKPVDDQIINLISSKVCCPSCNENLYDLTENSEYILIPKNQARLPSVGEKSRDIDHAIESVQQRVGSLQVAPQGPVGEAGNNSRKQSHTKLKRTCSYCKKPGHSRARCFTRLSKEPGQPKPRDAEPDLAS